MALIVEDGTGLANAETYASVAEADAYFTKYANAAWTGDTTAKEVALRKAGDYMLSTFRNAWAGQRVKNTQGQDWPRNSVEVDGFYISAYAVPPEVKAACMELALQSMTGGLLPTMANRTKKRVKVGPLEVEYDGNGGGAETAYVQAIKRLAPFLASQAGGFSAALVRC